VVVQEINRYNPQKERKKKTCCGARSPAYKASIQTRKALQEITTMSIFPSPLLKA
jgi:hypothetical protein